MSKHCPNCGSNKDWNDKKGHVCPNCNYKNIETKVLDEAELVFCNACGNHYLMENGIGCRTHDFSQQVKVKLKAPKTKA